MTEPQLLTIKDVQELTKLGRTTIYEVMRRGELPYIRIGRSVRIRHDALDNWLMAHEEGTRTDIDRGW